MRRNPIKLGVCHVMSSFADGLILRTLVKYDKNSNKIHHVKHFLKKKNRRFIKSEVINNGGEISAIFQVNLTIPRVFEFHRKKKRLVKADLYRVVKSGS